MPLKYNKKTVLEAAKKLGRQAHILPQQLSAGESASKASNISKVFVHNKEQNAEAIKDLVADRGIGTFLDVPVNILRSLPPVKKAIPDDKYNKFLYNYQSKIVDADRRGGDYLANKGKFLKKMFTTTDLIPRVSAVTDEGKVIKAYVPTEVSRLSAPFDKSKEFVVPTLALYGVSSLVDNKSSDEEGGTKVAQEFNTLRGQLVEKIATSVQKVKIQKYIEKEAALSEKAKQASEMLKYASCKIDELESKVEKLAEEKSELENILDQRDKNEKAIKLAKEMLSKHMIKRADYESHVEYLTKLSEDNFSILSKTVEDVPLKQNYAGQNGLDKLSCIYMDQDDGREKEKPSLEEAILKFSK